MDIIEKLPWYDEYNFILEGRRIAQKGIEDLENPQRQLQRVKKFYKNLGADYSKNIWMIQAEEDITITDKEEAGRLGELKRKVEFGDTLESAVQQQDDESISALNRYKNDDLYKQLVRKIMFYIGVSKVRKELDFIKKAYDGICKLYPLENASVFAGEGVYYFVYYFQCLQILIKKYTGRESYGDIKNQVQDRCYNARLMMNTYSVDIYLADEVKSVLDEIEAVEAMLRD